MNSLYYLTYKKVPMFVKVLGAVILKNFGICRECGSTNLIRSKEVVICNECKLGVNTIG